MRPSLCIAGCLSTAFACVPPAHAGVVLANTRVVFPGDARAVTVRLDNRHAHPVLVEAWVEHGAARTPDARAGAPFSIVPFAPHPPLVRIEPGKGQALRVHRLPGPLPQDRETLFSLNVLDIPPDLPATSTTSAMKIALHTRVKLFHRPAGLPGTASKAPGALRWRMASDALQIDNPTPYHVSIARVVVGERIDLRGDMVAPFSVHTLRLDRATLERLRASGRVAFDAINDVGGLDRFTAALAGAGDDA